MSSPRAGTPLILGGRYRVIQRLGSGGMASVLLAEDQRLGRLVAIKRLPTSSPDDALARFRREARIGASLNHPNIVSIFDSSVDEDALLIVMEYVQGESLKDQLRRGPLEPDRAVAVLAQIAAALDHAHAAGVLAGRLAAALGERDAAAEATRPLLSGVRPTPSPPRRPLLAGRPRTWS